MEYLFVNYDISEIVILIVILAFAVKELVTFVDWGRDRLRKMYDKDYKSLEEKRKIKDELKDLNKIFDEQKVMSETFAKIDRTFDGINKRIDMLIESDKEDIKAYITEKHHFFVYVQGWIDDYSLECLERRFSVYKQEHGNSFVKGLMDEIRALKKQPPEADKNKYIGTAAYVQSAKEEH